MKNTQDDKEVEQKTKPKENNADDNSLSAQIFSDFKAATGGDCSEDTIIKEAPIENKADDDSLSAQIFSDFKAATGGDCSEDKTINISDPQSKAEIINFIAEKENRDFIKKYPTQEERESFLKGEKDGVIQFRQRCKEIMCSEEAKGREEMAQVLALKTDTGVDEALSILSLSPTAHNNPYLNC